MNNGDKNNKFEFGKRLNETNGGTVFFIIISLFLTISAGFILYKWCIALPITLALLALQIVATICRDNYKKSQQEDVIPADINQKIISSLSTIREQRFQKILDYLESNYANNEFTEIITDPLGQMRLIKDHFKDIVLEFFKKTDTENVFSNLAYKINGDIWRWVGDGKVGYSANELANDPRSTFFSVINGINYEFHPIKIEVDNLFKNEEKEEEKERAGKLKSTDRRYLRGNNDDNNMLGSIICKHTVLKIEDKICIESVLILHTSLESLTKNMENNDELAKKTKMLEHYIVASFEKMLKVELALLYMKETKERCLICGEYSDENMRLLENERKYYHKNCVSELLKKLPG